MKMTDFSVIRPVFITMAVLIVIVLGVISLSRLPIDLLPEVEYPTLTVATSYENASPEEVEELITRRVEEAIAAVPGVEEFTSVSAEGNSNVRITFAWGTNLDVAAADIRERLDRIIPRFPDDADRPQLRRFDPSAFPILIIGAASELDPIELRELMEDVVQQRLERIPGVATVDVWGGLNREIQVNLDPDRVIALGLPLDEIQRRITEANILVPAGTVERDHREVTIRTPGYFANLEQLAATVVAMRDGAPVYLDQIATIEDTHERRSQIIRINGEPGFRLAIRKQSGTNTVDVARRVLAELDRINADLPQVNLVTLTDQSGYIEQSIRNVSQSVLYGGALAILVLLFFLRNIRSTIVIGTAIPISLVATFSLMYFGGFTLNLMTLGGLALGVGMMVDNAIVVLENIARKREETTDVRQSSQEDAAAGGDERKSKRKAERQSSLVAAIDGTREVTPAIIAGTLTTLAIFIPLLFVEGIAGVLFTQLGYVISFALFCSLVVAITFIPMLCGRLLRAPGQHGPKFVRWLFRQSRAWFEEMENGYQTLLRGVLRARALVLLVVIAMLAGSIWLIPLVGGEFMPEADEGEVRVSVEMEVGVRLATLDERMRKLERVVLEEVPEIESYVTRLGSSGWRPGGGNTGRIQMTLVPEAERTRSSLEIADDLRDKVDIIPGAVVRTREGQGLFLLRMGAPDGERLQIEIRGHDLATLDALAARVAEATETVSGVTDVSLSREAGALQELVRIDRDRTADLGLSVSRIARSLETAIAGSRAGEYREGGREYRIRLSMQDSETLDPEDILAFTVTNDEGEAIALRNVIEFVPAMGPVQIDRKNQQRTTTVSANIAGRDLISIVADVREALAAVPVPRNYEVVIAGDYEEQQEAFSELMMAFLLAIVLVYMVMACLYESLRDPLIVMFSVPLALIGVVVMLLLTETPFSVPAFIGSIMLGGIVVNNAILIVDQATRLRRDGGLTPRDAALEAGRRRMRPILMTSLTTILGLVPLALGVGEGAEAQAPLARAVIGGLISATVITLFIIPVLYTLFYAFQRHPAEAAEQRSSAVAPA
ncbi:MAG: efflux RND transporter permease subunit [Phycisphaerales bacterium]|nr:MAG: efflux RND transporter permease subunit [Phycisphaerales bacterium]